MTQKMGSTSIVLKGKLQELGKWADFCRIRDDFKAENGCTSSEARKAALVKLGLEKELGEYLGISSKGGRPSKKLASSVDEVVKAGDIIKVPSVSRIEDVDFTELKKKKAHWGESIDWVVANAYLPIFEIDFSTCPDMKAYSYLKACIESPTFRYDFMIKMGQARMPKKVEEEPEDRSGNYDGKEIVDLLKEFGDLQ